MWSVELWCFLRKDEMYVPIQPHPMFRKRIVYVCSTVGAD